MEHQPQLQEINLALPTGRKLMTSLVADDQDTLETIIMNQTVSHAAIGEAVELVLGSLQRPDNYWPDTQYGIATSLIVAEYLSPSVDTSDCVADQNGSRTSGEEDQALRAAILDKLARPLRAYQKQSYQQLPDNIKYTDIRVALILIIKLSLQNLEISEVEDLIILGKKILKSKGYVVPITFEEAVMSPDPFHPKKRKTLKE